MRLRRRLNCQSQTLRAASYERKDVKLIVGLGNPGIEYQFTPHNLGFLTIDRIATDRNVEVRNHQCRALTGRMRIEGKEVLLAKPETFMNLSGVSVRELLNEYQLQPESDLIVIYDELDLPLGRIRIRKRGSSAGHNGMNSIIGTLTSNYAQPCVGTISDVASDTSQLSLSK